MTFHRLSTGTIIAVAIAGVLLTVTTAGLLNAFKTVPLTGTITTVNVDVYSDSLCTQECTSLNVGTLNPGGTATQTIYVKNTGTVLETLTMTTSNWNPAGASSSLTLSWDRQNYVLNAGQSIQATLTLTVGSNTGSLTNFSCDVTITGTQ